MRPVSSTDTSAFYHYVSRGRDVSVVIAPMTGPVSPDGDVTTTYTYHVPTGNAAETVDDPDVSVPVPACVRLVMLVMPAVAP